MPQQGEMGEPSDEYWYEGKKGGRRGNFETPLRRDRMNCTESYFIRGLVWITAVLNVANIVLMSINIILLVQGLNGAEEDIGAMEVGTMATMLQNMQYLQRTDGCNTQLSMVTNCLLMQRFFLATTGDFFDCDISTLPAKPDPSNFASCRHAQEIVNYAERQTVEEVVDYFARTSFQETEIGDVEDMWSSILSGSPSPSSG